MATFILQLSSEGAEEVCLPDSEFLSTILSNGSTFTGPSGKLYLDYKTQLFLRKASNAAAGSFPSKSVREEALEELFPEDMAFRLLSQLNDGRGTADQGSDTGEMNTWLATTALGRKSYLRRACSDDEKGNSELLQMIESQTWTLFTHQMLDWLSGIDPPEAIDHPGQLAPVPSESSLDKMSICGDGDPKNTDLTSHVTTILSLDTDSEIEQAIARATREIEATYNLETHPGFGGNGLPNFGPESRLKLNHAKGLTLNQPTRSSGHPRSFSNTDVLPPSLAAQALSATHPSASQAAYTAARDLIAKRQAEALAAQLAAQQAQHETLLSTLGAGSPIPAGLINTQQFPITLPAQRRPWNIEEEQTLLKGLDLVGGPHWSKILNLFGQTGSVNEVLAGRTQVQLKDKARNLKLWFLKEGLSVPEGLSGVTGDLETRGRGNMTRNAKAGLKGPKKEEEVQGEGEGEGEGGKEVEGANGVQE